MNLVFDDAMIVQQDSIIIHESVGVSVQGDSTSPQHTTLTPAMVLSWLPRSATPAQQDSAIQAHFKPSEIRWSQRPDTLHLPGHDKGHNMLDVQLPQYYLEGFFSKDTLLHPELPGGRYGVAGTPVPYSVHGDNVITTLLLLCFVLSLVSIASARHFIVRQAKSLFYMPRENTVESTETANELRFQGFLVFLTSLLLALIFYFYTLDHYGDTFALPTQYHLIAVYLGMSVVYFLAKGLLYAVVNGVFFDGKRNQQWLKSLLFITSFEGICLFPAVVLYGYFSLPLKNIIIYFILVLIIVKILTIYKCYNIFFHRNVVKLQIILYFCTLEILPLMAFWASLEMIANSLKINF